MNPAAHISRQSPSSNAFRERVRKFFESLQETICATVAQEDKSGTFVVDQWERPEGGGGVSRVLEEGAIFEKAGVNTSTVFGVLPETIAIKMNVVAGNFYATGISLVIHPRSPMIPTVHANYRYFEMDNGSAWFGGGTDITPYYLYEEDIRHFHQTIKLACDGHDPSYYPRFKKWCDEYFFIKHRSETRGAGGIFFDYIRGDMEAVFAFVQSAGVAFIESYLPIVQRRVHESWGDRERAWQLHRRGRYAEFNLVYDRGTAFGLETNGRVESILMSLPPVAQWRYNVQAEPDSPEQKLLDILHSPREWVA
ncbi:MAG: oxygen-dependent coproporphyrinogen oxidase [Bacteroidota bacterium]